MNTLVALVFAHLVGDFLLQSKAWVEAKERRKAAAWQLWVHVLLHGLLALWALGSLQVWPLALLISLSHLLIDSAKLYAPKEGRQTAWFLGDQAAHLLVILAVWVFGVQQDPSLLISLFRSETLLIYATALYFLIQPAGLIMAIVMEPWSSALQEENKSSLSNAGKIIGMLERVLVFTFIITSHWEAVGFLLAAKSVFRFGDLSQAGQRKLTEYMLIGTLISFGLAIGVALLVQMIIW